MITIETTYLWVTLQVASQLKYHCLLKTIYVGDNLHNDTILVGNISFKISLCAFKFMIFTNIFFEHVRQQVWLIQIDYRTISTESLH